MSKLREIALTKLVKSNVTKSRGYYLDDPEQWNDVKAIPEEIEDKVKNLYLDGYDVTTVKSMLPDEHKWVADFMAMYHISMYQGRHGLHSY